MQQYTNELSTELQASMDTPRFSAEELTEMSEEVLALIEEQAAFCRSHPVIAIYRIAVAGCLMVRKLDPLFSFRSEAKEGDRAMSFIRSGSARPTIG